MDNLYYVLLTNLAIIISFVTFIVLITVHIVKKKKFTKLSYLILFISLIGMYLFIPSRFVYLGYAFQSPEYLEKAIKFSINPYEKRLCYLYMADIYEYDFNHNGIKDGNKFIEYMEKALKGEYNKYPLEAARLALMYSIKGDYNKTIELNKILNHKTSLSLRNIYILNNEYDNALSTFNDEKNCGIDIMLKAAIYSELEDTEKAEETQILADEIYEKQLNQYKGQSKRLDYIEKTEKYKSVGNYKNWLAEQKEELKF